MTLRSTYALYFYLVRVCVEDFCLSTQKVLLQGSGIGTRVSYFPPTIRKTIRGHGMSSILRAKVRAQATFYGDRNLGHSLTNLRFEWDLPDCRVRLCRPMIPMIPWPLATGRDLTDRHRKVSPIIILRWVCLSSQTQPAQPILMFLEGR